MVASTSRCGAAALVVLLCVGALRGSGAFRGTGADRLVLTGFSTRERRPDGSLKWQVNGRRAVVHGNDADIEDLELTLCPEEGGEQLRLTSPKCLFNRVTKVCRSSAPIHVKSPSLEVRGVGYDIMAEEQKLHIRSNVRMVIRKAGGLLEAGVVGPTRRAGGGTDRHAQTETKVP